MTSDPSRIASRFRTIRESIDSAASASGRSGGDVALVAVTKTVDRVMVDAAYAAGLRAFGENRVADARAKFAEPMPVDARLHLIGQLQSNKAGHVVDLFDVVESVDRPSLIVELERIAQRKERLVPVLLQVNVAGEAQKAGCAAEDVDALVDQILGSAHLRLDGLMTIAPLVDDAEQTRPVFAGLREIRDRLAAAHPDAALAVLSMGMSNDFRIAVEEGSTHVRVGRALFG